MMIARWPGGSGQLSIPHEKEFRSGLGTHPQQQGTVRKPVDVRRTVGPLPIPNGYLCDLEIELCRRTRVLSFALRPAYWPIHQGQSLPHEGPLTEDIF